MTTFANIFRIISCMVPEKIAQNSVKAWILAARPKTLSGAAVPIMIGVALAYTDCKNEYITFNITAALLCFLFAMTMQIDANFINDYFDFVKGTDDVDKRLGPRRACAQGWIRAKSMKHAIIITTLIACAIGMPLIFYGGIEMILIGILCIIFCFLYTTYLSYIGMGDVLVLVFFGIIPICITYFIQTHTLSLEVLTTSIACGLTIDCLLLINNFRDRDTDRESGKNTLVVRIGTKWALKLYLYCGLASCILGTINAIYGHPIALVLPIITYLPLHIATYREIVRINKGKALNACLTKTSRNILIYGIAICVGILII